MRSSATRLLFVCLAVLVTFGAAAQSSDPFALTPPLVSQAVTSCGDLSMSNGLIDSTATTGRGNVLSNGTVKLTGGRIDGDATAGPGSAVKISGNGAVSGAIASATTTFPCSIIELGALATTLASANDNASIPLTAQHKVAVQTNGDFKLSGGDSLTLAAGTYFFHKFTMSGGSTLTLAGAVRILTTSDVSVSGGSVAGASPWQLHFWSSATKFDLGSSTFAGFIYAPSAPVAISGEIVSGSVYGGTVTITGNSHITRLIDNTPPVVTIISPVDHETVNDLSHVTVRGTVTDPETAITSFQVNGADVALATDGSFTTTLNLSTATPPSITARATNAADLSTTSTVTVQSSITQLTVAPPSISIDQNATGHLAAIGTYADGSTADLTASATWTTAAPSIATVSAGTVTGVAPGTATITATLGSFSGSATVTVNPLLQSLTVAPVTATAVPGGKQPFTATGTYSDGTSKDLTSTAVWSTSDSALAGIDASGLATALSPGTVTVRATVGAISGTATLTVLATPTITSLQPSRGRVSGGDTVTITGTNFGSTTNTSVTFGGNTAVVSSATATTLTVTTPSHAAGVVDVAVTAPSGSVTKTAAFTYLAPPTVTSVSPTRGKTAGGDSVTVTGTNFDAAGTTLTIGSASATNIVVTSSTSLTATTPAGTGTVSLTATTAGGSATLASGFTYVPPPVISSFAPSQGQPGTSVTINGSNFDAVAGNNLVFIGDVPAAVTSATTTRLIATVGTNAVTGPISVTTIGGAAATSTNFVVLIYKSLSFTASATVIPTGGHQQFSVATTKYDNTMLDVTSNAVWTSADSTVATVSSAGLVSAGSAGATDITAAFSGLTATVHVSIATPVTLPPGTIQGPPLDPTVATTVADSIRFLYSGPNAIQTGVAANAIADNRAAVVSGRVLDASGAPLSGVVVATAQHPEFGQTVSRTDGRYDFVWNGGGSLHLAFTKPGYISSDRLVATKWNQQKPVDDVALVAYDGAVTTITAGAPTPQVAQGSSVTDTDGTRRATILFPSGTTATLTNADGTTQPATTLHVRATEFTVGANGPKAMPAALPPTTAYTYCVELSVDEAPGVTFSRPLPVYLENFLGIPVGTAVPVGYFDRASLLWMPSPNGVVLKILAVANGTVSIDTDGDGVADDSTRLSALGIDSSELAQLASLYAAGQTLWRIPVTHFTPFDGNFAYGPIGAISPQGPAPDLSIDVDNCTECPKASVIETENQRLRESIPLQGTPYRLEYNSGTADRTRYQVTVHAIGTTVPTLAKRATVILSVAGRTIVQPVNIAPNQDVTVTWDGLDAYGRPVEGSRIADISVLYTYPGGYGPITTQNPAWALVSPGATLIAARGSTEVSLAQGWSVTMGHMASVNSGFGGWTFSAQARYDPVGDGALYEAGIAERVGDPRRTGQVVLTRVAGNGALGTPATSGIAATSIMVRPTGIAPLADGSFYVVCGAAICLVDPLDNFSVIAGNVLASTHQSGSSPDGTPALGATILPFSLAVAPDGTLYFSEDVTDSSGFTLGQIRRIVNGALQTVAGGFRTDAPLGDGGPATAANVGQVNGMVFGLDGALYISDGRSLRVRRIGTDGIINTVAGGGSSTADNIPALTASAPPRGIAFSPDGILYFSTGSSIRRMTSDGMLHYVAGTPTTTTALQDGGVATAGSISNTWGITVAADGTLLFASTNDGLLWTVNGGIAHIFAGTGNTSTTPPTNGIFARAAVLQRMFDIKAAPDGSVYLAIADANATVKTQPVFRAIISGNSTILPDRDAEFAYIFEGGRHVRTVNVVTGTTTETLSYEGHGYLSAVTDVNGQATTVERDAAGVPTAIIAPGGQRTELSVGALGLERVTNAAGESYSLSYNGLGLLSQLIDPRQGVHKFTYDDFGHLTKDEDPGGGFLTLARTGSPTNFTITQATSEGRAAAAVWQLGSALQTTRPLVGADGLATTRTETPNGALRIVSPGGTARNGSTVPDSRFGMTAPTLSAVSVQLPSGLTMSATASRQVTLATPTDPLSATTTANTVVLNGRTFRTTFDRSSRLFTFASAAGRTQTTTFDDHDRPVTVHLPGRNDFNFTYDAGGLLLTAAAGTRQTSFTYDPNRRLKTVTDTLQRTMVFDYDAADRLIRQTFPDGRQIAFQYDANGNLVSITPPARLPHGFIFTPQNLVSSYSPPTVPNATLSVTTYTHNRDRQLIGVSRPDGTSFSFAYDGAGRIATLTEPLGNHQYAYDGTSGLLTSVTTPDGNSVRFTYDGDLPKTYTWAGAVSGTLAMNYDANIRVTSESVNGANSVSFGYDADNLLTSAGALTIQRDAANGAITGTTLGSFVDTYGYNAFGEVTSCSLNFAGAPLLSFGYVRDDLGRITQVTETSGGQAHTTTYGYDAAGHLSDVTSDAGTTHYGYDDNGNRTSVGAFSATYDAQDRLTTYNGASYFFSDAGDLQKKIDLSGTTTYTYDTLGNLRKAVLPNGTVVDYVIDALNRRVGKKVNGTLTAGWLYDSQLRIVAETDGSGTVTKRFVYGSRATTPDYVLWSGGTYRIVSDHRGSPRWVLDASSNTLVEALTYDEFGSVLSDTRPGFLPFGFAGGLYDQDTKLVRFGARDYDPQVGRWTSKDPMGFSAGEPSLYVYASNDPINSVDPSGLAHYVILVGDPGLGVHNTGNLFDRAAQTKADALEDEGNDVTISRVSSVWDVNKAIATGPPIDGGIYYFGHSSWDRLYVGQNAGDGTNVDKDDISALSGRNIVPGAVMQLYSCYAGSGPNSIAAMLAKQLRLPVSANTRDFAFSDKDGQWTMKTPHQVGPIYMVPNPNGHWMIFN